ncbi:hypothetical protein ASF91_19560 [Rhizobium sp. Leaf155]|nr:hypothetical protein ASF91_19560 [Rhizobium sp. Leaf155]
MLLEPAKAVRFESQPKSARWFCVSVEGGADFTVSGKLSTAGVEVFVLREKWIAVKDGKKIEGERPVFGGYIFVRMLPFAEAFHAIKQVKDVREILGDGVRYTEVPNAHLEVFTKVCEKIDVERMPVDRSIGQGNRARITHDVFAGYDCVVVQVSGGRNPRVRVSVLGFGEYAHDVTLPLAFLQKL